MRGRAALNLLGLFPRRGLATAPVRSSVSEAAAQVFSIGLQVAGVYYLTSQMTDRKESEPKVNPAEPEIPTEHSPTRRHS